MAFPVQNSTLDAAAVGELIRREYGLKNGVDSRFWRKGMADVYRITAGDRGFYLKVFMNDRRSRVDVEEEVRLLRHLIEHGVSVCEPIRSTSGEYMRTIDAPEGERYAVLYAEVVGSTGTSARRRRALGRMVARMHQAADRLDPPYRRNCLELEHVLDDNLAAIGALMAHRGEEFEAIERISSHVKALVSSELSARPPEHGVCHGDLFGGDIRYGLDDEPAIFDFESSGTGWRALDIAVYQGEVDWMNTTKAAESRVRRRVGQFLEGYTSIRELTNGEYRLLELDSVVHHIFLMGLVLRYVGTRDGWYWANDGFIDWHMKWFRHWLGRHPL